MSKNIVLDVPYSHYTQMYDKKFGSTGLKSKWSTEYPGEPKFCQNKG